jgi:hypothetical protein
MPRGPKGEKRPADAIGNAILIAKIATGEMEESTETTKAAGTGTQIDEEERVANAAAAEFCVPKKMMDGVRATVA